MPYRPNNAHLRVPASRIALSPKKRAHTESRRKQVLLVDDEADTVAILEMWLSEQGFDVSVAVNGIEALSRIQEQAPDVIVTDQSMPRMTGLELCSALRARAETRHIPIILCSAHALPAADGLYDRAILKPASLSHISDEISSVLAAVN